jgi:16S rRNA (guanine966-N2)-methyltransferase
VKKGSSNNRVRLIGGQWRRRLLDFPDLPGLRPSSDRLRETLFNWLQPVLVGSRCLDLFAGSGALGFEAASRGARQVVLVEQAQAAFTCLEGHRDALEASNVTLLRQSAQSFLQSGPEAFDIAFLDPPFESWPQTDWPRLLHESRHMKPAGWVFLELPRVLHPVPLPDEWVLEREKKFGDVQACLVRLANS